MRLLLIAGILFGSTPGAAQAHEKLGTWCWNQQDPGAGSHAVYAVTWSEEAGYIMTENPDNAERTEFPLVPVGVNEYAVKGGHSVGGIILRADGMLELYNSQGSIGAASPCAATTD